MSIAGDILSAANFSRFFQELWGYAPYDWQRKLAETVIQAPGGAWPEAIALPTAAGKTACIDIAVFALAALTGSGHSTNPHPRRIFYAVDRRNIVDQTFRRSDYIAGRLKEADSGILKTVADCLRLTGGGDADATPLALYRLRGGIRQSSSWERNPCQPAIITTTVDQIGSALLFSAYGKGRRARPVHAGLAANDSIIILDEAHCAQPFLQTARAVRKYRQWATAPLNAPFQAVIMSATPPPEIGERETFRDTSPQSSDPNHPLGRKQTAVKPTILITAKRNANMGQELADAALELAKQNHPTIVVFANRVSAAREACQIIKGDGAADAILITGRMRQRERDDAMGELLKRAAPDLEERAIGARPLIAVATQSLEIGADLDFDALVTECASMDALRQRFGRLNRTGRDLPAPGRIIIPASQVRAKTPDPIYGEAISATWEWLKCHAATSGEIDFGIANIAKMLAGAEDNARRNAPAQNATVMLPSHIDAWAQTSPGTGPNPSPDTYLHGIDNRPADVQVCWRAGLDLNHRGEMREILRVCPPNSLETLPVPLPAFRQWLAGQTDDDTGDAPGNHDSDPPINVHGQENRRVIRWRGGETDGHDITGDPRGISPGDTIIIPTAHPGNPHAIGDLPDYGQDGDVFLDIGDETNRQARGRPTLRISDELLQGWQRIVDRNDDPELDEVDRNDDLESDESESMATPGDVLAALSEINQSELTSLERQDIIANLLDRLSRTQMPEHLQYLAVNAADLLRPDVGFRPVSWGNNRLVLQPRHPLQQAGWEQTDDDDDTSHARRARRVTLERHSHGVGEMAAKYAQACGINGDELEAIRCAALLHDVGKADPLFQKAMHGGNPYYDEILAKSPAAINPTVRHELMSVRMAESNPELLPDAPGARELALHLIASHHGYGRPFAQPGRGDAEKRAADFALQGATMQGQGPTGLERMDSGIAERYWSLTRKYGWWGLAYLEAIVRVADWKQSENEEHGRCN